MQASSTSTTLTKDRLLLQKIKNGEEQPLVELYRELKPAFVHWMYTRYSIPSAMAEEIFQLVMITFYENAVGNKLNELHSSLKTYLFAIGKNKALEFLRKQQKVTFMEDITVYHDLPEDKSEEELQIQKELSIQKVAKAMEQLKEGCRKVISMFYYQKHSMRDIMEAMGYQSEAVARNQRYRCVAKLKSLLQVS